MKRPLVSFFLIFILSVTTIFSAQASDSFLPGMPKVLDSSDLYAADKANQLSDTVKNFPSLIYVPNTQ